MSEVNRPQSVHKTLYFGFTGAELEMCTKTGQRLSTWEMYLGTFSGGVAAAFFTDTRTQTEKGLELDGITWIGRATPAPAEPSNRIIPEVWGLF